MSGQPCRYLQEELLWEILPLSIWCQAKPCGIAGSHLVWGFVQEYAPVWPDWAIYWTLGNFLKPMTTIDLPKSPTLLGNFCKGVKIYHFYSEIILGNFYRHLAIFFWSHCSSPRKRCGEVFLKMGHSRTLFHLFSSFQTNITIFTTNVCEKYSSSRYKVLGFEPTIFRTRVSSHNR